MVKPSIKAAKAANDSPKFKTLWSYYKWLMMQPFGIGSLGLPSPSGKETPEELKAIISDRISARAFNKSLRYRRAKELDPALKSLYQSIFNNMPAEIKKKPSFAIPEKPEFDRMARNLHPDAKRRIKKIRARVTRAYRKALKRARTEARENRAKRLRYILKVLEDTPTFLDGAHNSRLKREHEIELNTRKTMRKYLDTVFNGDELAMLDFDNFFNLHPLKNKQNRIKKYAELFMRFKDEPKKLRAAFHPFLGGHPILPFKDVIAHTYAAGIECGFKEQKRSKPLDLKPVWGEAL